MNYIGIDPGQSGGIALIFDNAEVSLSKMPETWTDIRELFDFLSDSRPLSALIEKVHSMPGQGVASSFKFGRNFGFLEGMLTCFRIEYDYVSPQKWQKAMGCMSHGDKNITKSAAQRLFPKLKITHATADALLIAEYCRRTHARDSWQDI